MSTRLPFIYCLFYKNPIFHFFSDKPGNISFTNNFGHFILAGGAQVHHVLLGASYRISHTKVFLRKGVLKICSKFTGERPCRSAISIKLHCNFNEMALRCGCSPVNLLHIFRIPISKNTPGRLLQNSHESS